MNSISQLLHQFLSNSIFKLLFKHTSGGWRSEVKPPGITARSVFSRLNDRCFTGSVMWAMNEPKTSQLFLLARSTSCMHHAFLSQTFMCFEFIYPFSWAETTTPCLLLMFGIDFLLMITIGLSFEPSPQHANTTVTRFFSFPVLRILIVFSPKLLTWVEFHPRQRWYAKGVLYGYPWWSNEIGLSSLRNHLADVVQRLFLSKWKTIPLHKLLTPVISSFKKSFGNAVPLVLSKFQGFQLH